MENSAKTLYLITAQTLFNERTSIIKGYPTKYQAECKIIKMIYYEYRNVEGDIVSDGEDKRFDFLLDPQVRDSFEPKGSNVGFIKWNSIIEIFKQELRQPGDTVRGIGGHVKYEIKEIKV